MLYRAAAGALHVRLSKAARSISATSTIGDEIAVPSLGGKADACEAFPRNFRRLATFRQGWEAMGNFY